MSNTMVVCGITFTSSYPKEWESVRGLNLDQRSSGWHASNTVTYDVGFGESPEEALNIMWDGIRTGLASVRQLEDRLTHLLGGVDRLTHLLGGVGT